MGGSKQARPLVSLLVLTYNQQHLVKQAVEGALTQTYSPLEIIISDDCSSDETWAEIQRAVHGYHGPHTLRLNRNEVNQGLSAHVNLLVGMAQGELLFATAGDDISLPERCEKVVDAWLACDGKPDLIACDLYDMAYDGEIHGVIHAADLAKWTSLDQWMQQRPYVVGAGHVWHRRLFERFGPVGHKVRAEDQIMTFRAVMLGGAITIAEPLVKYRRGGISGRVRLYSSKELMARWFKSSASGLAEIEQIIQDAGKLGMQDRLALHFEKMLAKEHYVQDMYRAAGFADRINLFLKANAVPAGWRWRIFAHAGLPMLTAPFFFLKRSVARLKK